MKRNIFLLISLLAISISAMADKVSVRTAQIAAQTFMSQRMGTPQQLSLVDFADRAEFPNFYVFGNEHCFVIIAGDDCVQPVLGYSMEGGFGNGTMPECVSDWLKAYTDGIASVKESRLNATVEIRSEWEMLLNGRGLEPKSRSNVKPLIRTKWNQRDPFNSLCPLDSNGYNGHAAAGCGAIAMAQIMNYWEHPVRGVGSHCYVPATHTEYDTLCASFGETVYDWDNMKNIYSRGYNETEALAVATLVYHCGVSVDMDYDFRYDQNGQNPVSNVSQPILDDALIEYFDYSSNTTYVQKAQFHDTIWGSMLKQDLNDLQPVLYRAASNNQGANAHIFICDGYDENDFFHFNWGHAGDYDGYYTIAELHEGITNYNYGNYAMFGCRPNTPPINPPNDIHASVTGQAVNVSWSSVNTAACYKLYRDGDLINGHITGVSYTESDVPFGSHTYYVKSVKLDGTMSLKSNTAVADVHFSGPKPIDLQASVNSQNVNLSWQTPNAETAVLQYGTGDYYSNMGYETTGTYWGQRYSASTLCGFAGMSIEKVTAYFLYGGDYTLFVYKGDEINTNELVYQQSFNAAAESWYDIVFPNPVAIDYTQDLWVVLYSTIKKPASVCEYNLPDMNNAILFSKNGVRWTHGTNRSCMMKTYLTDGTYTYNLYRNGDAVATDLSGNTYTDTNLPDGIYDYRVTTNYFGGESDPSNTAHVQVGDPSCTLINGYGTSDEGYYLIASPFDDIAADDVTGMTDGDYDLYCFDQSQEREWRNYKADAFALMAGKGYLYAHKTDVALRITGTQPYDGNGTIALEYVEGHPLTGWNLVGNPYLYDVTSCATEHVAYGCYRMNETKDDLVVSEISEAHPLKPLEACFVRATAENATITFNPHRSVTTGRCESIRIEVAEKGRLADRLMVVRGGANALQKLSLKEKRTKLFATHGQEELSIVPCEGGEQPFCFQAGEEGTYTLTVALDGMKADYLHLVDVQTGADVDLLETQSYEFAATPTDEPCRFKLIIKTEQSNECNEN